MPKGWRTYLASHITLAHVAFFIKAPQSCCFGEYLRGVDPSTFKRTFVSLNPGWEDGKNNAILRGRVALGVRR